jgi:hypothetical protein
MGYFDNFDNKFLNKYKIILKNRKKFTDVFFYWWIEGHAISLLFDSSSKIVKLKPL